MLAHHTTVALATQNAPPPVPGSNSRNHDAAGCHLWANSNPAGENAC